MNYRNLVEVIEERRKDKKASITFINSETSEQTIAYNYLYEKALSLLYILQKRGVKPREEVVFQIADDQTFLEVFWACLLGGFIPVPVTVGYSDENQLKLIRVWETMETPYLITTGEGVEKLEVFCSGKNKICQFNEIKEKTILLEGLEETENKGEIFTPRESDIALIQFSSGSTGNPKGVVLTHKNLLYHIDSIRKSMRVKEGKYEMYLSWMPLTHDMGLICMYLVALVSNWGFYLMPSKLFARYPLLWLKKLTQHKITVTSSPNFGFKHVLNYMNPKKLQGIDLSSIWMLLNGAEPISPDLCFEFLRVMAPYGLKEDAVFPCYGLAEATVAVSVGGFEEGIVQVLLDRHFLNIGEKVIEMDKKTKTTASFVEVGISVIGSYIRVTNDNGNVLGDRFLGHIQIKGENVTSGYYRNPEATAEVFTADGWLDTGDVGFFRDGKLVVTGRLKDILFFNGQNFYSHDLERIAAELDGIEDGKVVIAGTFSQEHREDLIVCFILYRKKNLEEFVQLANKLKEYLFSQTGLKVHEVIPVKGIPKTTSGKIRRVSLIQEYETGAYQDVVNSLDQAYRNQIQSLAIKPKESGMKREELIVLILEKVKDILGYIITDLDKNVFRMGVDSIKVPQIQRALEGPLNMSLPVSLILDYPTVNKLADYLSSTLQEPGEKTVRKSGGETSIPSLQEPIAVIGMGCRFPGGAKNPARFWENLIKGECAITEIPSNRWDSEEYYSEIPGTKGKMVTRYGGFLDRIDEFDAQFFEITPVEAETLDPQQRLLLEVAWETIESAGIDPHTLEGSRTGCFIGISGHDYSERTLHTHTRIGSYSHTGSMTSIASGRISYFLGLQGPTKSIDTACSSSLVAIDEAVTSLRNNQCDQALAGGVNLILSPNGHIGFSQLGALSPDGKCKTFDDTADGYGRSEGCGIILLKKFSDAQQDGDPVLALIKSTSVKHNGKGSGLTVPNGKVQEELICEALEKANLKPGDVDYVEAHGSGTRLGDPQEIHALGQVFKDRSKGENLLVGSVKTNIGHTESAAGMAGIIKIILSLQHEEIPKHINFKIPNKLIPWGKIPVKVIDEISPWKRGEKERIAGVSSFGISGTNAHVILQEAAASHSGLPEIRNKDREYHMLTLSSRRSDTLNTMVENYIEYLSRTKAQIKNICFTSNVSRSHMAHRLSIVGRTSEEILEKLKRKLKNNPESIHVRDNDIVFLFTGQGSHYPGIAKDLYDTVPIFREAMKRCDTLFFNQINESIVKRLYTDDPGEVGIGDTTVAQAVIFSIEYSLCQLWESWGITPSIVVGHSIGEIAAACIAGVFELEEAVKLVSLRGQLMQSVPMDGLMAGIMAGEKQVEELLKEYQNSVSIAAVNTPDNVTISGRTKEVKEILSKVKQKRYFVEPLDISHPFHSILMAPVVKQLKERIQGLRFSEPRIPMVSSMTGKLETNELCHFEYWASHIQKTVRFSDAMNTVNEMGKQVFVEIGGTGTLCSLAGENIKDEVVMLLPSLRKGVSPWKQLCTTLSELYTRGVRIDWKSFNEPFQREKVILPTYPFNRKSYWYQPVSYEGLDEESHSISVETIRDGLSQMIAGISGLEPGDIGKEVSLFSLGLDSLMLVQLRKRIKNKYTVDIPINSFLMELTTIEKIADFLGVHLPKQAINIDAPSEETVAIPLTGNQLSGRAGSGDSETLVNLIQQQMQQVKTQNQVTLRLLENQLKILKRITPSETSNSKKQRSEPPKLNIRSLKLEKDPLTEKQQQFLETFTSYYNHRTKKSKEYESKNRYVFSHWLTSLNFRTTLKELIYPLISTKAEGACLWDLDGNRYVDLSMGYGVHFFGHQAEFIQNAIQEQLNKGFVLSPHMDLIGEVASLITELTGVQRVNFCNTGSEAVMIALRVARTVTKRKKIVRFEGAYHGIYDGVLAESDEYGAFPLDRGIVPGAVEDTIVLGYGSDESLEQIRELGDQLAAVLVEPVQSRRPGFQPKRFLTELRKITNQNGVALIFDEMITGFRIHPGGAQAHFGIEADMVTYGKIIGGGMPIGIVAGKGQYLDAIDGGQWNFGDESFPEKETTFVAGTFSNHPLSLAAARACLLHMKAKGPSLQEGVNEKAKYLADSLNKYFESENVPILVRRFGSLFRFESFGKYDLSLLPIEMDILHYLLMSKGVYMWERRVCVLSTSHTHEDLGFILKMVRESIQELRAGGFSFSIPDGSGAAKRDRMEECPENYIPVLPSQERFYALNQMEKYDKAGHLFLAVDIHGALDVQKVEQVFFQLTEKYEALRQGFKIKDNRIYQGIFEISGFQVSRKKISNTGIDSFLEKSIKPFDLEKPPLIRVCIGEINSNRFILLLDFHHIISDGHSANILIREFLEGYQGLKIEPVTASYKDYFSWWNQYLESPEYQEQEKYWTEQYLVPLSPLELPLDFTRPRMNDFSGAALSFNVDEGKTRELKKLAKDVDGTLFMVMLAAYVVMLSKLSLQQDMVVGIPVSTRGEKDFENLVGFFSNTLALRINVGKTNNFHQLLEKIKEIWIKAYINKEYPIETLIKNVVVQKDLNRNPLFDVMFVYENGNERKFEIPGLECKKYDYDLNISLFDFTLEVIEEQGTLGVHMFYRTSLFGGDRIQRWKQYYLDLLDEFLRDPGRVITDLLKLLELDDHGIQLKEKEETSIPFKKLPQSDLEKKLLEVWERELGLNHIGVNQDFFELGGRSLDTIRVVSGINDSLGIKIPLTTIFKYPSIFELANYIENHVLEGEGDFNMTIPPLPQVSVFELSQVQLRYWYGVQMRTSKKVQGMEITDRVVVMEGDFNLEVFKEAFNWVVQRHGIFRTTYDEQEGRPTQVVLSAGPGVETEIGFFDGSELKNKPLEENLKISLLEEYHRKFNLQVYPLFHVMVYRIEKFKNIVVFNAPHISFDGWSFTILLREIGGVYNCLNSNQEIALDSKAIQYGEYVTWQNNRIQMGELDAQKHYWENYLEKNIPVSRLPADRDENSKKREPSKIFQLLLNSDLSNKIDEKASQLNTTVFILMMAVLKSWISILSNQSVVTIGSVFSGRTHPDLEKIPGIMMNTLPIRVNLTGNPSCQQVVDQVKQVMQEVYMNQDYPIDLVIHKIRKQINLNQDIFSLVFIGQETLDLTMHFEGVKVKTISFLDLIQEKGKQWEFMELDYELEHDMLIEMMEEHSQIRLFVRYNSRRYSEEVIKRYFSHLEKVLETFIYSFDFHLSQFPGLEVDVLNDLF